MRATSAHRCPVASPSRILSSMYLSPARSEESRSRACRGAATSAESAGAGRTSARIASATACRLMWPPSVARRSKSCATRRRRPRPNARNQGGEIHSVSENSRPERGEEPDDARQPASAGRRLEIERSPLSVLQSGHLLLHPLLLAFLHAVPAALFYEVHDLRQLSPVQKDAVRPAHVHDDARSPAVVRPVHELPAHGTGPVMES